MHYLLDTNIVIPYLANDRTVVALISRLSADGIAVSAITLIEAWQGLYIAPDPVRAERQYRRFFDTVPLLFVDDEVAKRCARLRFDLQRAGKRIRPRALDLLIAATTLHHGLELVTRNRADFDDIPGLALSQI